MVARTTASTQLGWALSKSSRHKATIGNSGAGNVAKNAEFRVENRRCGVVTGPLRFEEGHFSLRPGSPTPRYGLRNNLECGGLAAGTASWVGLLPWTPPWGDLLSTVTRFKTQATTRVALGIEGYPCLGHNRNFEHDGPLNPIGRIIDNTTHDHALLFGAFIGRLERQLLDL